MRVRATWSANADRLRATLSKVYSYRSSVTDRSETLSRK